MARQGPCSHCGITQTRHWRRGPPEKPVLCNACGSRWRSCGTLHDYMPRHAKREIPRYQLLSELTPRRSARNDQKQEVGVGSSSINCMQMEETNDKVALINPGTVTKRKRSELKQVILSPVERLRGQLYNIIQKPDFENTPEGEADVTLIYARNHYTPANEIGLGAMLLVSPADASFSTNVPLENPSRINNNIPDNLARQNETTGNERDKANARENSLAPHHMDTTSRVSGQELHSQRDGPQIGSQVKRPRGRSQLSTTQGRFLDKDRKSGTADDSSQA